MSDVERRLDRLEQAVAAMPAERRAVDLRLDDPEAPR
jgi:hypothetical protein